MEDWNNRVLNGFVTEQAVACCGVTAVPGEPWAVVRAAPGMDRKRYQRQYSVLRGYAVLALGRGPQAGERVELSALKLPGEEGADAAAAVWFARACESTDAAGTVMAVYQGFRALPSGQELMRSYLSPAALEQFPQWVQVARGEENDLGENSPEPADRTLWAQVDREVLCRSLRQACLDAE